MKFTLEINDDAVNHIIDSEVKKAIADQVKKTVDSKSEEILKKKIERMVETMLPEILGNAQVEMQKAFSRALKKPTVKKAGKSRQ